VYALPHSRQTYECSAECSRICPSVRTRNNNDYYNKNNNYKLQQLQIPLLPLLLLDVCLATLRADVRSAATCIPSVWICKNNYNYNQQLLLIQIILVLLLLLRLQLHPLLPMGKCTFCTNLRSRQSSKKIYTQVSD